MARQKKTPQRPAREATLKQKLAKAKGSAARIQVEIKHYRNEHPDILLIPKMKWTRLIREISENIQKLNKLDKSDEAAVGQAEQGEQVGQGEPPLRFQSGALQALQE